jgi:hypothetical protein
MTTPRPRTVVFAIADRVERAELAGLCARLRALLEESGAELVVCEVGALADPDAVTVDALARLQLTAQRLACRLCVRHASRSLRELLVLAGLAELLLGVEPVGQAEEREHGLRVEEEGELDDPSR